MPASKQLSDFLIPDFVGNISSSPKFIDLCDSSRIVMHRWRRIYWRYRGRGGLGWIPPYGSPHFDHLTIAFISSFDWVPHALPSSDSTKDVVQIHGLHGDSSLSNIELPTYAFLQLLPISQP